MQIWQVALFSVLLAACTPREIRCDSKLTAINSPIGQVASKGSAAGRKP
jgi:hypothetical protein